MLPILHSFVTLSNTLLSQLDAHHFCVDVQDLYAFLWIMCLWNIYLEYFTFKLKNLLGYILSQKKFIFLMSQELLNNKIFIYIERLKLMWFVVNCHFFPSLSSILLCNLINVVD